MVSLDFEAIKSIVLCKMASATFYCNIAQFEVDFPNQRTLIPKNVFLVNFRVVYKKSVLLHSQAQVSEQAYLGLFAIFNF